mmetsp:Transcript_24505/g.38810  ORF Transcript_24505/g.38810 Transcript_24505/m.38810 type:complete len:228 (+) Transcript_24505:50-733(+)
MPFPFLDINQQSTLTFKMSLKLATLAAALMGASAFVAPNKMGVAKSSSALKMSFENELGVQPPLGFWDPLGLLNDADQQRFDRLRYVEIKHGRISMLAILGHILTTAGARWPGAVDLSGKTYAEIPAGIKALGALPFAGVCQIVAFIGLIELGFSKCQDDVAAFCEGKMDEQGWDEAKKDSKRAIELNNGRAAQMGILALMVHETINNDPYVINSLLGAPVDFNAGF